MGEMLDLVCCVSLTFLVISIPAVLLPVGMCAGAITYRWACYQMARRCKRDAATTRRSRWGKPVQDEARWCLWRSVCRAVHKKGADGTRSNHSVEADDLPW